MVSNGKAGATAFPFPCRTTFLARYRTRNDCLGRQFLSPPPGEWGLLSGKIQLPSFSNLPLAIGPTQMWDHQASYGTEPDLTKAIVPVLLLLVIAIALMVK